MLNYQKNIYKTILIRDNNWNDELINKILIAINSLLRYYNKEM